MTAEDPPRSDGGTRTDPKPAASDGGTRTDPKPAASDGGTRTESEPGGDGGSVGTGFESLRRVSSAVSGGLRSPRALDIVVYALYAVAIVFFVFPVLWLVSASLRPPGELLSYPFRLLPPEVSLSAYEQVFREGMVTWLLNSTIVTILGVSGIVAVSIPAAYAFSRFEFRGRRGLLGIVLLFQMISPVIILVPLYTVMSSLGLLRTRAGLVLLYVGIQTPFSIWLLKGYFDTVPTELDYAARIDGCNRLQTLRHVLLRPVAPGIAVVGIFNVVVTWSEFVLAFTVLGGESSLQTISIGVYNFSSQSGNDWRAIAAASVIGMLPLVITFIGLQRYFVKGLVEGSLKGE
jgi:multiple sugar transport system permease protein